MSHCREFGSLPCERVEDRVPPDRRYVAHSLPVAFHHTFHTFHLLADQKSILNLEILSPSLRLTHRAKESAVLECLPRRATDIASVTWMRLSGIPLPANQSVDQFGNLHVADLRIEDTDSYACGLYAITNAKNVTQFHTLQVIEKPFISKLPQNIANPSSQTARFECTADGVPEPHVQWFKDAVPVSLTGRLSAKRGDDHTLVISQSVSSDAGIYQCVVENEAGSATAAAQLLISAANDQPRPPRILQLQPLSPTSVRLHFESSDPPGEQSIIKAYTIHYTAAGGQELQVSSLFSL